MADYHALQLGECTEVSLQIEVPPNQVIFQPSVTHADVAYGLEMVVAEELCPSLRVFQIAGEVESTHLKRQHMSLCVHLATYKHNTA
jgi:hypothetical protein